MGKIFTNDPPFYQQLRAIAIPVAVQNLITVGVRMLDTLMLGSMGDPQGALHCLPDQRLHFAALLPGSPLLSRDHHVHLHQ